ncbi:hypothetical protein [Flavobacterium sp.]|uniref:DUF7935 family protein n=1 Tax=Flavobacterium sp. TaxID=239 RepID=UPI00379DECD4
MDSTRIIELLSYTLPTLIMALIAYNFFELYTKNESEKRNYLLQKDTRPDTLSLRLQAYERMTLFLERINLSQLLVRIAPISNAKNDYQNFIIAQIEQEFEHNITQQIYLSDECWSVIMTAKNATIQMILLATNNEKIVDANQLREYMLKDLFDKPSPSGTALSFIKEEVAKLW